MVPFIKNKVEKVGGIESVFMRFSKTDTVQKLHEFRF